MDLAELTDRLEAVSRVYAARFDITRDDTWHLLKIHEEVGELTDAYLVATGRSRRRGRSAAEIETALKDELCDVVAHTLLMARHLGFDLTRELERKWLVHHPDESAAASGPQNSSPHA